MTDKKKCPKCGREVHSNAQFCIYCMNSMQPKTDITPAIPRRRSILLWLIPAFALFLLIALVVIGYHFSLLVNSAQKHMGSWKPTPTEAMQEQENDRIVTEDTPMEPDVIPTEPDVTPTEPDTSEATQKETSEKEEQPSEPDDTLPKETAPDETISVLCDHYYVEATCNAPMTCTKCGTTRGEADENAHQWIAEMATVYHEAQGHYEDTTDSVKKTKYLCFFCGYSQTGFDSMDAVREHITVHSGHSTYDLIVSYPDMLTETREVWEQITVRTWVVDQEAYEETIIEGYSCSVCGKKKDA